MKKILLYLLVQILILTGCNSSIAARRVQIHSHGFGYQFDQPFACYRDNLDFGFELFCDRGRVLIEFELFTENASLLTILNDTLGDDVRSYEILEWENPLEKSEGTNIIYFATLKDMQNFDSLSAHVVVVEVPPRVAILRSTLYREDFAQAMDLYTAEVAFSLESYVPP